MECHAATAVGATIRQRLQSVAGIGFTHHLTFMVLSLYWLEAVSGRICLIVPICMRPMHL
jgi:hypothetical protein